MNIDEDHVCLPEDLVDYYAYYQDTLEYRSKHVIEKRERDYMLPPLPLVPEIDLYKRLKCLLCPEITSADTANGGISLTFPEDAIRELFQSYFTKMVIPPYSSTIVIEEKGERIWILDKAHYLRLYQDKNSNLFMRLFIDKSMFYLFFLDCFSWNCSPCSTNNSIHNLNL